jgi:hypothetical protein
VSGAGNGFSIIVASSAAVDEFTTHFTTSDTFSAGEGQGVSRGGVGRGGMGRGLGGDTAFACGLMDGGQLGVGQLPGKNPEK